MVRSESRSRWPAVWRGTKRAGSALAMGIAGTIVFGPVSFAIWHLGNWPAQGSGGGLLTGFLVGAVYGWRTPARDAAIVFVGTSGVFTAVSLQGAYAGHDWYWTALLSIVLAAGTAIGLTILLPLAVPLRMRYKLAVPLSILFGPGIIGTWIWWLCRVS